MNQLVSVDVQTVEQVLLADGWHRVKPGSFHIGELTFVAKSAKFLGPDLGVQGVQWREQDDSLMTCPSPAVLAVKSREDRIRSLEVPGSSTPLRAAKAQSAGG